MNRISVFLPTRKGSERIKNKNTRPFSVYINGGLLELKLSQLIKVKNINEIILSTNDSDCLRIGENYIDVCERIKLIKRPESLAASETKLTDLIKYAGEISNSDHIMWTHVTSPFITAKDYEESVKRYFEILENGYDSLMSVRKITSFLWSKEKNDIINRKTNQRWPRTQDLTPYYEIDSGIFIARRNIYIDKLDRIGEKPFLFEMDIIKSFDIDWESDFTLAETLSSYILGKANK